MAIVNKEMLTIISGMVKPFLGIRRRLRRIRFIWLRVRLGVSFIIFIDIFCKRPKHVGLISLKELSAAD